jgi:hypothetical protein
VAGEYTVYAAESPYEGPELGDWHPYSEFRWEIVPGRFWGKSPLDEATEFDERDYDDDQEEKSEAMYDNSPEQEIEPHDYGDKQVKPKQQGFAQRLGDNPYKMAHESINNLSSQLLKEYEAFKNAQ